MVPAAILGLWAHPQALPVCRALSEMAGKRPAPVAAYVTDAVMGNGPCLVRGAAAAGASTEPDKGGGGGWAPSAPSCRSMVVGSESCCGSPGRRGRRAPIYIAVTCGMTAWSGKTTCTDAWLRLTKSSQ